MVEGWLAIGFANGRVIDAVLVLLAVEAAALLAVRRWFGRGPGLRPLLATLLAGAALMMALRAALRGVGWQEVAAWLVAALLAHVAELAGWFGNTRR